MSEENRDIKEEVSGADDEVKKMEKETVVAEAVNDEPKNDHIDPEGIKREAYQMFNTIKDTARNDGLPFVLSLFNFDKMVSTKIIKVVYFVIVTFSVLNGLNIILESIEHDFFIYGLLNGLKMMIIVPLVARVIAEALILFFNINDNLVEIKNKLNK